jgi:hypothetical protein
VSKSHDLPPQSIFRHAVFPHIGLLQSEISYIFKSLKMSLPCPLHSRGRSCSLGARCPFPHEHTRKVGDDEIVREWMSKLVENIGNKLTENDYLQIRITEIYDNNANVAQSRKMAMANAFENHIEGVFSALGVRYFNGSELKKLGGTDGMNALTPDLMLLDDVEINGAPLKWIDAKNQFGNPTNYLFTSKLKKQWKNYHAALGPGAFIFNGGCMQTMINIFPRSTILNDVSLRELEVTIATRETDGKE